MPKTIDRLILDHIRLSNVLALTKTVVGEQHAGEGSVAADHLFCLVEYLAGYPDKVHHPTEDLVFTTLLDMNLSKEQAEKVAQNRSQHSNLESQTAELVRLFEDSEDSGNLDRFRAALEEYTQTQYRHMSFEEQQIFPLALALISKDTWQELDKRFGTTEDPIFDKADKHFAALYRHLGIKSDDADSGVVSDALLRYLNATGIS